MARRCAPSGYTKATPDPPGGVIERGSPMARRRVCSWPSERRILYATLARGPKLSVEDQINSTRQFMRELNRLGVTSVIDAGGGFQNYPDDYAVIQNACTVTAMLTLRIAYNLFTQRPGGELADFANWTSLANRAIKATTRSA
jgi:predicted amidohydrolase YtcJ